MALALSPTMQIREGKSRERAAVPTAILALFNLPGSGGLSLAASEEIAWRGAA